MCRTLQLIQEVDKHIFEEEAVTVRSALNYCYLCDDVAALMRFDDKLQHHTALITYHSMIGAVQHCATLHRTRASMKPSFIAAPQLAFRTIIHGMRAVVQQ